MHKILLVEDDTDIIYVNQILLKRNGYNVSIAESLAEARVKIAESPPDMIVLDITLPDGSGLDFLKEVPRIPVLLLTSLGTNKDMVYGLAAGGDDYLAKPYDNDVLLARIASLLRRSGRIPDTLTKGNLILRNTSGQAFVNGVDLCLSNIEYKLLCIFVQNEDKIFTQEQLYEKAWGQPLADDTQALRTAIRRMRPKLAGSGYTITAEYGKGYMFGKGEMQ